MTRFIKILIFIFAFTFVSNEMHAQQSDMFKQKRERKRIWRKWRSNKGEYNPYLKKTAKKKPSAEGARSHKKEERRQKRAFKKELRKTRRKHGIPDPPKK